MQLCLQRAVLEVEKDLTGQAILEGVCRRLSCRLVLPVCNLRCSREKAFWQTMGGKEKGRNRTDDGE